jgi:hypothetical protein
MRCLRSKIIILSKILPLTVAPLESIRNSALIATTSSNKDTTLIPMLRAKSPVAVGSVVTNAKDAPPAMAPIQLGKSGTCKLAPQATPTAAMLATDGNKG